MLFLKYCAVGSAIIASVLVVCAQEQSTDEDSRFSECLVSKLKTGKYRSLEKNQAVRRLLYDCGREWEERSAHCLRAGKDRTKEDCNLNGAFAAALAVEMFNNKEGQNWDDRADQLNRKLQSAASDKESTQQTSNKIETHPDGSISSDYGNMIVTGRDFKWPPWMKTWQECVERARFLSFKNGFQSISRAAYANELNVSSDHYHFSMRWRCSNVGGERMVGIDVTSFPKYSQIISPRQLLEKLGADFIQ